MSGDRDFDDATTIGAEKPLLAGRYRVVRALGQGGMGSVWLAEDERLDGHPVAIKMLPSVLVQNSRAYRQLKQEALVSLKLCHPNIAAVRAFEEDNGNPFLVMDYIDGQSLDDLLGERDQLSEEETVRLLGPVADALDYAHKVGVVHRDVKPGNVMIAKDGTPYVLDFGIAREIQETMTRVTGKNSSGTLMYMSPEQLHGAAPKPPQDVYSFAAMAYECLTGHAPFSRGQIEYQIDHDTPEPLPDAIRIGSHVMSGLAKVPKDRPQTCRDVLDAGTIAQKEEQERKSREEAERAALEQAERKLLESKAKAEAARIAAEAEARRNSQEERLAREAEAKRHAEELQRQTEEAASRKAEMETTARIRAKRFRKVLLIAGGIVGAAVLGSLLRPTKPIVQNEISGAGLYRVIDLTDGTVTHLDAVPSGGWTDEYKTTKLVMRRIEAGVFEMGSPTSEDGRSSDEKRHTVTLTKPYYIGVFEVTHGQWKRVMGNNPSYFSGVTRPVEKVSWEDCQSYCRKIGKGYRLPTEAEWEHACRAGTTTAYAGSLDAMGWHDGNSGSQTHEVGTKRPNEWGLYDMHGNVWEWCSDCYGLYHGDETDPTGPTSGGGRVNRGGGWCNYARNCRSADRIRFTPGFRDYYLGFRLCCSAGPSR